MKQRKGIALIAAMVFIIAILGFAAGALFLTRTNLKIAENVKSQAEAKYLAEAGVEAMFISLEKYYNDNDANFPTYSEIGSQGFALPATTVDGRALAYGLVGFNSSNQNASLKIEGKTASGANYISELLVEAADAGTIVSPIVKLGLESEGIVSLTGSSNFVSAGLHGNKGFTIKNATKFNTCIERNLDGTCKTVEQVEVSDLPVSAATGENAYTCVSPNAFNLCGPGGIPSHLSAHITVTPAYYLKRDRAIQESNIRTDEEPNRGVFSPIFNIYCDRVFHTAPRIRNLADLALKGMIKGKTVCVESGAVSFPSSISLDGVKIISKNSLGFSKSLSLTESTLVSLDGGISVSGQNTLNLSDSKIFSEKDIIISGQHSSYSGLTTIATAGNMHIRGSSSITSHDGKLGIGLGLIASGDIKVSGSSNWFVSAIAGGTFTYNGTATLFGAVAAKGNISSHGGIDIDSGLDVINDDFLEENQVYALIPLSRR